ncbi:MAG: zinc-dependent metalloprotease [Gemmatimonadaceae bacterium]|nr:zinc-dependent metalloprotease [Gemmatimonadaceae bacterium]
MKSVLRSLSLAALVTTASGCFYFRASTPPPARKLPPSADDSAASPTPPLRPYVRVITRDAKTRRGLFVTHRVGEKLYFEIPRRELNRDMLLVGRLARSANDPSVSSYGGDEFAERILRWERQGMRVILRSPSFEITADSALPVYQAVSNSNYPPIVGVFNIETFGPDSAPVIDVARLYTSSLPEFSGSRSSIDERRSFVENAVAFPDNVEVEATQTYTPPSSRGSGAGGQPDAVSVLAHWSMIRLPERLMMARIFDDRVGFFAVSHTDFGTAEHRAARVSYITRYRLEKKNSGAAMSDPVKPITYYIDPATPAQWRPWIKRGVEEWQKAFEAAGFTNAIVARDAPTASNDPDWSAEDVRYSVVRWVASTIENAYGPHVHDPRTGEILNGSIAIYHNILNQERSWYFTQVAPLDPRAAKLPLPDSLMGRLLQSLVAHEVGHTLGLSHNFKSSAMYPADSVRSASWVHRMGYSPSIMDYVRYDYVAQPEDRIAPNDLVARVGPYDIFATMWGYKPVPGARTPEDEKPVLDSWARMQDSVPWLRFSTSRSQGADYAEQTEAVGDADAIASTGYGLRNIKRVVPMLIPATERATGNNNDLESLYSAVVEQWTIEMNHVTNIVGGAETREKYATQPGARFIPLPRGKQQAAVRFLLDNAFRTPTYLLDERILRRIEPEGALDRIRGAQSEVLGSLLNVSRMARLVEYEALAGNSRAVYSLSEMLSDVRTGIWSELGRGRVVIDPFRRNLQRTQIDLIGSRLAPAPNAGAFGVQIFLGRRVGSTDARALLRGELLDLDSQLRSALPRAADRETRLHILDARDQIDRILHPNK